MESVPFKEEARELASSFCRMRKQESSLCDPGKGPQDPTILGPRPWASSVYYCEKEISVVDKPLSLWCFVMAHTCLHSPKVFGFIPEILVHPLPAADGKFQRPEGSCTFSSPLGTLPPAQSMVVLGRALLSLSSFKHQGHTPT